MWMSLRRVPAFVLASILLTGMAYAGGGELTDAAATAEERADAGLIKDSNACATCDRGIRERAKYGEVCARYRRGMTFSTVHVEPQC